MQTPWYLMVALVGCSGAHENGEPPSAPVAEDGLPTEPEEAQAILDDMNAWCAAQGDECQVAMSPEVDRARVASGETNGWIAAHREQLRAHGVEVVWDRRRFVSQIEADLIAMIGGMFAVDHIGPEAYDAILSRARARAPLYLGTLAHRIVPRLDAEQLSSMYAPHPIELLSETAPEEALTAARAILAAHRAALEARERDDNQRDRLRQRIATLESMIE